jgi:hypothetical protein
MFLDLDGKTYHPCSKDGTDYSPEELLTHLVDTIIPQQRSRGIPDMPTMDLPFQVKRPNNLEQGQLMLRNWISVMKRKKGETIAKAIQMRDEQEDKGELDRYEKLQPRRRPEVDESLIGVEMEQLWDYMEPDRSKVLQWCQGIIVGVKTRNRVHIQWNKNCLRDEGGLLTTEEVLMKSKYNKHVEGGWRMSVESAHFI